MIDTDRTYYCLNSDIGNISVNRYDNNKYGYTSRFQSIVLNSHTNFCILSSFKIYIIKMKLILKLFQNIKMID